MVSKHTNTGHSSLRNQVLAERGITLVSNGKLGYIPIKGKTSKMKLLEQEHGADIRDLIATGGVRQVARKLGVHPSIITRWREALRIEN